MVDWEGGKMMKIVGRKTLKGAVFLAIWSRELMIGYWVSMLQDTFEGLEFVWD